MGKDRSRGGAGQTAGYMSEEGRVVTEETSGPHLCFMGWKSEWIPEDL